MRAPAPPGPRPRWACAPTAAQGFPGKGVGETGPRGPGEAETPPPPNAPADKTHPAASGPSRTIPGHLRATPGPSPGPTLAHLLATRGHLRATPSHPAAQSSGAPGRMVPGVGSAEAGPDCGGARDRGPGAGDQGPGTGVAGGCSPRLPAGGRRRLKVPLGHCSGAAAGGGRASPRAGAPNLGPPPTLPAARLRGSATPQPHLFLCCSSYSFRSRFAALGSEGAVAENNLAAARSAKGGESKAAGQMPTPNGTQSRRCGLPGMNLALGKNYSPTFHGGCRQL